MNTATFEARPGKMLVSFVARGHGERVVAAAKAAGAYGGTIAYGKALGDSSLLRALALSDIPQDVVFIVMGGEAEAVTGAVVGAAAASGKIRGMATLLDVSEFFVRMDSRGAAGMPAQVRSGKMESTHVLITIIVNSGFGEDAMAAARRAGAVGGTLMNARGTGTEEDVSFFGITLVPEKEMLFIVAERQTSPAIVAAVQDLPALSEPGGGIIFTMDVDRFALLGRKK